MKPLHIGTRVETLLQCSNTPLLNARQAARMERIVVYLEGSSYADAAGRI